MKVLIIGSGGREHCLAWKVSQSALASKIYCAPGNAGTALLAKNVDIKADDIDKLLNFALKEKVDLTIVGPEAALVKGIVDKFQAKGLKIFGPTRELARLEGSKVFAKEMMRRFNLPTADFKVFDDPAKAKEYIGRKGTPVVIKADGLAAGKGVVVCSEVKQAEEAVDSMLVDKQFGAAGERIIVEDRLKGQELSVLIFTDGDTVVPLASSQDHKRAFDNDQGPNTGGMGAYSPAPLISKEMFDKIIETIFMPLIKGLKKEGKTYKGILYGGLMIDNDVPYVLEFNVRFGDPETQAILPKLKSDLVDVMLKAVEGKLNEVNLEWDERFCLCVVLASGGYPGSYEKKKEIKGLEDLKKMPDIFVFHAGTRIENGLKTSGGRVLNIVSLGDSIQDSQTKVYAAIEKVHFDKMFYRKDIGNKAISS